MRWRSYPISQSSENILSGLVEMDVGLKTKGGEGGHFIPTYSFLLAKLQSNFTR